MYKFKSVILGIVGWFVISGCTGTAFANQCGPLAPSEFFGVIWGWALRGFEEDMIMDMITDCTLDASWEPSSSPNVVAYRIYQDNTVVAIISAVEPLWFEKPYSCCTSYSIANFFNLCTITTNYSITAVDVNGEESEHVNLVIKNR